MTQIRDPEDISQAKNPDLRAALGAMRRAAKMARQIAIQTNTAIVIVENGVRMRITAEQLRREQDEELEDAP